MKLQCRAFLGDEFQSILLWPPRAARLSTRAAANDKTEIAGPLARAQKRFWPTTGDRHRAGLWRSDATRILPGELPAR